MIELDQELIYIILAGVVGFVTLLITLILVKKSQSKKTNLPTKAKTQEEVSSSLPQESVTQQETQVASDAVTGDPVTEKPAPVVDTQERVSLSLSKTRGHFFNSIKSIFSQADVASEQVYEELEEALLAADVSFGITEQLIDSIRARVKEGQIKIEDETELTRALKMECTQLLNELPSKISLVEKKPYVISIVGINGVGKTTTIGKLAHYFKQEDKSVLLGSADTFRAAAIDQLQVWADRTESQFVAGKEGGDPGAVAFDSVQAAKARDVDVAIVDTAGRLHTKKNLMDELAKVKKVMSKVIPDAPHETWLILDGTLGQNSIRQAKEFCQSLEVTGVIVTKLDGTAKGGAIFSVIKDLGLPVHFLGIGEQMQDLIPFRPQEYVEAIFE